MGNLQFLVSDDATKVGNSRGATRNVWITSSIGKFYIKSQTLDMQYSIIIKLVRITTIMEYLIPYMMNFGGY